MQLSPLGHLSTFGVCMCVCSFIELCGNSFKYTSLFPAYTQRKAFPKVIWEKVVGFYANIYFLSQLFTIFHVRKEPAAKPHFPCSLRKQGTPVEMGRREFSGDPHLKGWRDGIKYLPPAISHVESVWGLWLCVSLKFEVVSESPPSPSASASLEVLPVPALSPTLVPPHIESLLAFMASLQTGIST